MVNVKHKTLSGGCAVIQAKAILPRQFKVAVFRDELVPVVKAATLEAKEQYLKTEATWERQATWGTRVDEYPTKIVGKTWTENDIVRFLEKGTRVRYATMSPDFQAKTRVRWIGSGPGAGGLMYISKLRPRPGIKARHWTSEIKKVVEPFLKRAATAALGRAASKSGHGK